MSNPSMFLSPDDVAALTGRKSYRKQIEQLRAMAIQFWINARGIPVVPVSAVTGQSKPAAPEKWTPSVCA
ncbi:MAG: DUF4224 domain-containing protein [Zoogloeaceae bacterium]|nr:DUF4224 domain-containing protein [Zoogloeaceae bacterium]